MLQTLRGNNKQGGFTLIELMIVIAIIGILAAIAIPNFISYRNKSFCSAAESDANAIAGAIADYFAIPSHVNTPDTGGASVNTHLGVELSGQGASQNSVMVEGADPNQNITIEVTDGSGRCPDDYTSPAEDWGGSGTPTSVFTKNIELN